MKLRRKYCADAVEYAIERCEEMGFIDDAAYAREKAEYLRSVKGYAPVRILGELRAAGIDNAIADEALDSLEFSPEDEIPRIIERKYRGADLSDEKTQAFYASHIGKQAEVLFEKATRGRAMHGFTRNYVRVELSPADSRPEYDNQLMQVVMEGFNHDKTALKCRLINA